MQEDKRLKLFLVLQSFCPLFILIFIQHVGHCNQIMQFFVGLYHGEWGVFEKAIHSIALGDVIITLLCVAWFLVTIIVAVGFHNLQDSGFSSYGETITISTEKKDSGATFLVTFVLPLLVNDVSTFRGFVFFVVLLGMVILLLMRSDLFYQNPVLVALKYKTFEFQFEMPYKDVQKKKSYIGLSKGEIPLENTIIKRKYIADNVFLVYND